MNLDDFYPTPPALIQKLVEGIDLKLAQPILEPSAGKGDIVDYLKRNDREYTSQKVQVDCIEINPDLQHILRGKGYAVVHDDFLTFNTIKRYNLIVANFPFSDGDKHLQKALSLLEQHGGALACLVNAETLRNPHTNLRKTLATKIATYDGTVEFLSEQFTDAERTTNVEVALIRVTIPQVEQQSILLDRLAKAEHIEADEYMQTQLVEKDFVKALVARFKAEARLGTSLIHEYHALQPLLLERMPTGQDDPYNDSILKLTVGNDKYGGGILINNYLKELRYKYWRVLIGDSRFTGRYTSNVAKSLSDKLTSLRDYDFTEFNIGQLQEELNTSLITGIEDAILKLFDELSGKFAYHDEYGDNIHYYNGWKANKAHKINTKVIIPMNGFSSYSWNNKDKIETYGYTIDRLTDMVKALNYLAGELADGHHTVHTAIESANLIGKFRHIDFHYFTATFYKKGTCHITFTDQALLDKFNIFGARKRGWLPPSYGRKTYKDMDAEEREVVDNFQGEAAYSTVMDKPEYYIVETNQLLLN